MNEIKHRFSEQVLDDISHGSPNIFHRNSRRWIIGAIGTLCCGISLCAAQSEHRPLTPQTLFSMRTLTHGQRISMSQDGRYLAYVWHDPMRDVSRRAMQRASTSAAAFFLSTGAPDIPASSITIRDTRTNTDIILSGANDAWAPVWAPDQNELAYLSDQNGCSTLWIWRASEPRKPTRLSPVSFTTAYYGTFFWSPDSKSLIIVSPTIPTTGTNNCAVAATERYLIDSPREAVAQKTVEVEYSGAPAPKNGSQIGRRALPAFESKVMRLDAITGQVTVLAQGMGVDWAAVSPDGRSIAYVTMRDYEPPGGVQYQPYYDLWLADLLSNKKRRVAEGIPLTLRGSIGPAWSPDGNYLAYYSPSPTNQETLFVAKADGGTPRAISTQTGEVFCRTPVWGSNSRQLFTWARGELRSSDIVTGQSKLIVSLNGYTIRLLLTQDGTNTPYRNQTGALLLLARNNATLASSFISLAEPTGMYMVLKEQQRDFAGPNLPEMRVAANSHAHAILFSSQGASEPEEVWLADDKFALVIRESTLGRDIWNTRLGESALITWRDQTGTNGKGLLLLPAGYTFGQRIPVVLWLYEHSLSKANSFGLNGGETEIYNCQLLATRGIGCFYPDIEWRSHDVMQGIHDQVIAAITNLVDRGIADPSRIGVEGTSSGGYDVLAAIATIPEIKAAVLSSGIVDMMLAYEYHDGEWVEGQMGIGCAPWDHPGRYVANSPSYHLDKVVSPLLILQGTADTSATEQMDLAFSLLKHRGRTVEYRKYANEGHALDTWTLDNRVDAAERVLGWWQYYLTPQQHVARSGEPVDEETVHR